MVKISFPDRDTERRALGLLFGRFSGSVLGPGEHLVPEATLKALADQSIPFTVKDPSSHEISATTLTRLADDLFQGYDAEEASEEKPFG